MVNLSSTRCGHHWLHARGHPGRALEHQWLRISGQREEPTVLPKEQVIEGLRAMYEQNVFKRAALHVIVTMLNDEQTSIPRNTFMKLDANGDGLISEKDIADTAGELVDFYGDCSETCRED
eukprot:Skav228667  [mRNA]  locus=scaffold1332:134327:143862:- [translate_table: standard]